MSPAEAVMPKMVDMLSTGGLDAVSSMVAPSYRDHQGLGDSEIRGPEGFREVVEAARSRSSGLRVSIEDLIVEEPGVAARLRWQGVAASGETITRETIDILRVEGGRAVEHWGAQLWASADPDLPETGPE